MKRIDRANAHADHTVGVAAKRQRRRQGDVVIRPDLQARRAGRDGDLCQRCSTGNAPDTDLV